jgi:hypothetical protein
MSLISCAVLCCTVRGMGCLVALLVGCFVGFQGQHHTPRNLLMTLVSEVGGLASLFQWQTDASATTGLPYGRI